MKNISNELSEHLDGEVTTLCSCWRVVRRDGREFFFTDHDQDIFFEGNTYEAEASYERTAVQTTSDFGVSNLDVSGILDSDLITDEELRAGLFNRADVFVFIVNWANPAQGALRVRRGWFGEVTLLDNGTFVTEIRGLGQALTYNWIETYSSECRADFCDTRCGLNIADFTRRATVTSRGDGRISFSASALEDAPNVGTSEGAHRIWSIKPTTIPTGISFRIAEVRFWDQEGNLITGGRAFDNFDGDNPNRLRDGNFGSTWGVSELEQNADNDEDSTDSFDITQARWWIEFDEPVDIKQVEIIIGDDVSQAFTSWDLQYTNGDPQRPDLIWDLAQSFGFAWTLPQQSAVWSIGSQTQDPISVAATPQDIPPPFNTISTYVSGTVEWTSGKNRGRVCEILGYDNATNTITMFEAMSYQIEIGDTFDIAQGCDRTLRNCQLYDNVINRRAEDYIPGNDELANYPDAS